MQAQQHNEAEDKQLQILNYLLHDVWKDLNKKEILTNHESRIFWFILVRLLRFPNSQTPTVEEHEAKLMHFLYLHHFSMGDLAFIFDRSKSTIHETLKKFEQ